MSVRIFMALFSIRSQEKFLRGLLALASALVLLVLKFGALGPVVPLRPGSEPPLSSSSRPTLVLVWWAPFGNAKPLPDCGVGSGCVVTLDRRKYKRADAVVMHHRDLVNDPGDLPLSPRPEGQKWIWMNFESPSHTPWLEGLDGVFNLTMSYRLGSDIYLPYGYLQRRSGRSGKIHNNKNKTGIHSTKNNFRNLQSNPFNSHVHNNANAFTSPVQKFRKSHPRRRALVAWVISNWNEDQERVQFYWRLRHYIRVDIYGQDALPLVNDSVLQTISGYKFYLAFENSLHTDYITEKLWRNALQAGVVPVVLGPTRENYQRFLPADAFIHVDDFKSPRALAAYLRHLDRNPARYQRYLSWRRDYSVHVASFWEEQYCAACQAVQASRKLRKSVQHLAYWFQS